MLKSLMIQNFRCLRDVIINFEETQTLIVGENDSGKTSIVDAIRILFNGKNIEPEDFSYGQEEIIIKVELDSRVYFIRYYLEDKMVKKEVKLELSHLELNNIIELISDENFTEDLSFEVLKEIAKTFNIVTRSNSRFDTIKENIINLVSESLTGTDPCMFNSSLPSKKIYILDGKHMEDISMFVNERYFKDKKNNIWDELIDENVSMEQFVVDRLEEHSQNIKNLIDQNGITEKVQEFLPELTDIKIKSSFTRKEINVGINVLMLDGEDEILFSKKGDGTKRRITLALLGIDDTSGENGLYILDEVDTHLHVKAQKELMCKLLEICGRGNQIILTSHSPFVINTVKPNQIRSIINVNNSSSINTINTIDNIDSILSSLGIENIYLFFAKKILLVEGKTEESFLPRFFEVHNNSTLYNNLIKVINVEGIRNIPGFSRALLELNSKENIFLLFDNDIEDDTQEIIDNLDLSNDNIFKVGTLEIEDSFTSDCIFNAWKIYVESNNRNIGVQWRIDVIEACRGECLQNGKKFSKELKTLNIGCSEKLTKPKLGIALAEYCTINTVSEKINTLIEKLLN